MIDICETYDGNNIVRTWNNIKCTNLCAYDSNILGRLMGANRLLLLPTWRSALYTSLPSSPWLLPPLSHDVTSGTGLPLSNDIELCYFRMGARRGGGCGALHFTMTVCAVSTIALSTMRWLSDTVPGLTYLYLPFISQNKRDQDRISKFQFYVA